ncbi:DUF4232 domain-containing protein [Streptomyces sp. NPDC050509]|uniref:DUF4232 domain-containing protein n=1 Tax=Streptomyces sp. NPDC050509 TaxID=3365620 RepID=UPI0037A371F7
MSSVRNSRSRLLTAAATVALAAFSLTACSDGTGVADEGKATRSSSTVPPSTTDPASAEPGSGSSGGNSGGSSGGSSSGDARSATASKPDENAPAAKEAASSKKTVTCEGSQTKTVAAPLTRPVNHMLLTVTNTGSATCYLYGYPAVRFGEAQSVPPVIEDSQPQAVVTLEPGQSGYASVNLSAADGSAGHGRTEKSLAVYFQGRSGSESVGKGATPALPAEGMYIDDSLKVTYWQQSMDSAINW